MNSPSAPTHRSPTKPHPFATLSLVLTLAATLMVACGTGLLVLKSQVPPSTLKLKILSLFGSERPMTLTGTGLSIAGILDCLLSSIIGLIALSQIKKHPQAFHGKGRAFFGVIPASIFLVLYIVSAVTYIAFMGAA